MDNKFNNMLNDFMKEANPKDEKELNEKLQEFIQKYNNEELEYENTPLDDAYELLGKAENAKTEKEAIKLAKEAYKMCPECFDAILFQAGLEPNSIKRAKLLEEGLEIERKRLEKENYFTKDNIGDFYGIFETRPYLRGLHFKVNELLMGGKYKLAKDLCKEILRLNNNDNMGIRYILMAIYALLEDEKEMLSLYKKYPEEDLEMLFPLFVLYYKAENDKKAIEYLNRINKINPNFIKFFNGTIKENKKIPEGYYSIGDASEVLMYFDEYSFLIITLPNICDFVLVNSKSNKQ